jgi:hypothetical protein
MGKEHPAPYAMELKRSWRVIAPVRGRLEPKICQEKFTCKADALAWMESAEGKQAIAHVRGDGSLPRGDNAPTSALSRISIGNSPEPI